MVDTPIPERVTNKHLYEVILKGVEARNEMEKRIIQRIDGMETEIEHRLTVVETCVTGQKKEIEHLKRRDVLNGGLSALMAAIAGYIGFNK